MNRHLAPDAEEPVPPVVRRLIRFLPLAGCGIAALGAI